MQEPQENYVEPGNIRFLRVMVTILTATMIGGLLTVIFLIVIRVPNVIQSTDVAPFPATISLPDGTEISAFTRGDDWFAVVTDDNQILILDADSGDLRQTIRIEN
jgi:hypothetical protein